MADLKNTTNETRERPRAIIEALHEAGVDRELTMRVFDCIESERAETIAKAARLFYKNDDENDPLTLVQFSDGLNNMSRRLWGIVSAVSDIADDRDDAVCLGVLQLVNDAAHEMERITEAFDAERWVERQRKAQS